MSVTEPPPEMGVEVRSCLVGCRWTVCLFFFNVEKNQIKQSCGEVGQFFFEVFRCIVLL